MLSDYPDFKVGQGKPIDGLVILKMLQHAQEYVPEPVGQCMGLGNNDTLEVTHCFPLICRKDNDENEQEMKVEDERYNDNVLQSFRQVNIDSHVVGWYTISFQEAHYSSHVIDTMHMYQNVLGEHSVCLLFDPLKSLQGKLYLKALRLKPALMRMLKENADKKEFSQHIINSYGVTSMDIFQELPVSIHNCHLVDQFLWELGRSNEFQSGTTEENLVARDMALSPYQNIHAGGLVESAETVLAELQKYLQLTRRNRQQAEGQDDRPMGKPSRLETLYSSSQLSSISKHLCDISHLTFESVSLADAIQQAQSQPQL